MEQEVTLAYLCVDALGGLYLSARVWRRLDGAVAPPPGCLLVISQVEGGYRLTPMPDGAALFVPWEPPGDAV